MFVRYISEILETISNVLEEKKNGHNSQHF